MTTPRAPRADAVRNRRRILDAARTEVDAHGADAAMEDIARTAGVAVGTLYRHFPSKTDLVAAVIDEFVGTVAEDAEASLARARAGSRAATEVAGFLSRVTDSAAAQHHVKAAARALGLEVLRKEPDELAAAAALSELLVMAQEAGDIRAGITLEDMYLLMATVPSDQPPAARERWLQLLHAGIDSAGSLEA